MRRGEFPPRRAHGSKHWGLLGTPRGHQAPQDERRRFRRYFQGTFDKPRTPTPLNFHSAAVSGGRRLEAFDSPKHLSFIGDLHVHRTAPFAHSLRVDAQRECDGVCKIESRGKPFANGESSCDFLTTTAPTDQSSQLSEVMSGVAYLHGLRIVHGDLKGVSPTLSTPRLPR